MPTAKAGFGYGVFGTTAFGEEAAGSFDTTLAAAHNTPSFRFSYNGRVYDDFVIEAPTISRGADIVAGTTNIVLSNTPRAQSHGVTFAFSDNASAPHTITDSGNGFTTAGFEAGDRITVSGSTSNDGIYNIASVSASTITLVANDALTTEIAGDLVSILAQPAFNFFVNDRINTIGKPCELDVYFQGTDGSLRLMTGTVEEVSYNGATITLNIRDAMAPQLQRRIGTGQAPADYYSQASPYNPASVVWNVLTQWGGVDSTYSTDNTQINFTGWNTWFSRCNTKGYLCRARFPGTTVQNALLRVGELTNSFIWVDSDGVFQFTMFEPSYSATGSDKTYDVDNCTEIDIDIDRGTVKNVMKIYYGHDPDANYNPEASIGSRNIAFNDDNPDSINISTGGFLDAGFDNLDPVTVRGSERNDGTYGIETVTGVQLTLYAANGLVEEESGASITLSQSQDTITVYTSSLVFNDTGSKDTITDVTGSFVVNGFDNNDFITITNSTSNDGTYSTDTVTADTITLTLLSSTLTQEASGPLVALTQTNTISLTATTIAFNNDEIGQEGLVGNVDHINKSDGGFIAAGFLPQYQVTVSGAGRVDNHGTYRLANVTNVQMDLLHQNLLDENSGPFITITQAHTLSSSGKQFDSFITDIDTESIDAMKTATDDGIRTLTDEDKVVWHDSLASAASAAEEKLIIFKHPQELARVTATMEGFLSENGDLIHVTEAYKNINDQTYFIKAINIDIDNALVEITAERGITNA